MINVDIKHLDNSEVEISGEIATDDFMKHWATVVKDLSLQVKIPGFRSGKAPEKMVVDSVSEAKILWEMAEKALGEIYPTIVSENKLEVIGRPEINITKIAKNNPLGFTIKTAILPTVTLPDYRQIATATKKTAEKIESVTEPEIEEVLNNLRQNKALELEVNKDLKPEEKDKLILPDLTDDFAKSVGDFSTLAELKTKITDNLTKEKEFRAKEKTRLAILDALAIQTTITIPQILVDSELDKMINELKYETSRMGLKFEDYLGHLKKTETEMKQAWQADAEKRVKLGLIINEIIKDAKLETTKEELDKEVEHLVSHLGEDKPNPENLMRVYSYAENTILHNKVFALLEE